MFSLLIVFLLCGISSITANNELQCQPGWSKYINKCYWFSDFTATRDNAKLECESRESTLVTIDSSNINTYLEQHITGDTSFWIGLNMNDIAAHAWRWNTGGHLNSHITSLNWCDYGIDPFTACAVMNYNTEPCLKSYICTLNKPFICEKEKIISCPENWNEYSDGAPRCYYTSNSTQKLTRMEAARYCRNIGGRLVTVQSYLTREYLTNNRPFFDNAHWVGLSPYKWDDGTPYNWNNWDDNGPHIGESCVRLLPNGMWKYGSCYTDLFYFICEKEATILVSTTETTTLFNSASPTVYSTTTSHASTSSTTVRHVSVLSTDAISVIQTVKSTDITNVTSVGNSSTCSCTVARCVTEEVEKKYFIIIGILSGISLCSLGAVCGLIIYIKRIIKPKQRELPSQTIQYEDVAAAYYNVGIGLSNASDVRICENKDDTADNQQHNRTYEELSTRQGNTSVGNTAPGLYAILNTGK